MTGLFNWLAQIGSLVRFGLLSIPRRRGAVAATVFGIAGVVAVLVGVLSIGAGFRQAMSGSAPADAALVLRSGADSEMVSGFDHTSTRIVSDAPGIARGAAGPLASAELFVIIDTPKRSTGTDANVPLRGVDPTALQVRQGFKIVEGRANEWGKNELIAGVGAAKEFAGLEVGGKVKVGREEWPVVGLFSCGGAEAESEIWTDGKVLQQAYNRGDTYQSVHVKLNSPSAFTQFKDSLTSDPRLNVKVMREAEYYSDQSRAISTLINTLGVSIALLMAVGAVFGALNTMYSAVSVRVRELATLRALGFGSGAVVLSLMIESLILAAFGGLVGAGIAYFAFNNFHTSTLNWQSFSQVTFAFKVTPALLVQGMIWAATIGLIGGFFPAVRAARLPIAKALREM
jgi:putative ABC transport system permease protein